MMLDFFDLSVDGLTIQPDELEKVCKGLMTSLNMLSYLTSCRC